MAATTPAKKPGFFKKLETWFKNRAQYEIKANNQQYFTTKEAKEAIAQIAGLIGDPVSDGRDGTLYVKRYDLTKPKLEQLIGESFIIGGAGSAIGSIYEGSVNGIVTQRITETYDPVTENITQDTTTLFNPNCIATAAIAVAFEVLGTLFTVYGLKPIPKIRQLKGLIASSNNNPPVPGMGTDTSELEEKIDGLAETQKKLIDITKQLVIKNTASEDDDTSATDPKDDSKFTPKFPAATDDDEEDDTK